MLFESFAEYVSDEAVIRPCDGCSETQRLVLADVREHGADWLSLHSLTLSYSLRYLQRSNCFCTCLSLKIDVYICQSKT